MRILKFCVFNWQECAYHNKITIFLIVKIGIISMYQLTKTGDALSE